MQSTAEVRASLSDESLSQFDRLMDEARAKANRDGGLEHLQVVLAPFNGLTGDEAVRKFVELTKRREAEVLERKREQLARYENQILDRSEQLALLKKIKLANPTFLPGRKDLILSSQLQVEVTSRLGFAISEVTIEFDLTTEGRVIPWHKGTSVIYFDGGLEPGEARTLRTFQNEVSIALLSKSVLEHPDANLTLAATGLVRADGTRIPSVGELSDTDAAAYELLKDELRKK